MRLLLRCTRGAEPSGPWPRALAVLLLLTALTPVHAQIGRTALASTAALKQLSFEELLEIEVISASRQAESIATVASAIQVISREEIRRSGATSIPEALRLASNLQVAQANASQWAISARGFNNVLANKLLVMIDGRTVYTPLYAGVFWDVQDYPIEDIDRIEVLSGPGGTLWGANAVNGVINIVTRSAAGTQGLFVESGAGDELNHHVGIRYGGRTGSDLNYRVYARGSERDATRLAAGGGDAQDDWRSAQVGFRLDRELPGGDELTLQGDYYDADPNPEGAATPVSAGGGNVLGRWSRALDSGAEWRLQWYFDRIERDYSSGLAEDLDTLDIDWQHSLAPRGRQQLIWGFGIRSMQHDMQNLPLFGFEPANKGLRVYNAFLQDAITLADGRLELTLGSKLSHNNYTGFEVQPGIRASWTLAPDQVLWAGISRAVRTPSRIDRDFYSALTADLPLLVSDPDFESEDVVAYEVGWRARPGERLSLSVAGFFNEYDELRAAEPGPLIFDLPITITNGVRGESYGIEVSTLYQVTARWRLRGGYTLLRKSLEVKPGHIDLNNASSESNDPEHQLVAQSIADLTERLTLDAVLRHVDALPDPVVSGYTELDLRLAWLPKDTLEIAVVGRNLLHDRHAEFVPASPSAREIERSLLVTFQWRR